jgi:hypothetical protein
MVEVSGHRSDHSLELLKPTKIYGPENYRLAPPWSLHPSLCSLSPAPSARLVLRDRHHMLRRDSAIAAQDNLATGWGRRAMAQSRYPLIRRWTPEEHQQLLAMAAAGRRPDAIAQALGRTEPAVRGRANLHNIPLRLVTQKAEKPMIKGAFMGQCRWTISCGW